LRFRYESGRDIAFATSDMGAALPLSGPGQAAEKRVSGGAQD
jgi:hypothetical protein